MYLPRLSVSMAFLLVFCLSAGCMAKVKEPSAAGSFYPGDPAELLQAVDRLIEKAPTPVVDGKLLALIVPHAGYDFSGGVAAHAYNSLKGRDIDTVILIGPSHRSAFAGASVYTEGAMGTPLGTVPINGEMASALIDKKAGITFNPAPFASEHSLEVQLPFLQRVLKDFTIVPILLGSPTRESYISLTTKLSELLLKNPRTMLVISTDLSHYHDRATASQLDGKVIDAMTRMSTADLERYLVSREGEMCGGFPVVYGMTVARNLGATNGVLFRQADSGDVTGDLKSVVGYAAMGLYQTPLSAAQKAELIAMAKKAVVSRVTMKELPEVGTLDPRLRAEGAAFVTLKDQQGNLRGCIGSIQAVTPLFRSVIDNAAAAATSDPRFHQVRPEELVGLSYEVTIISPLEPLDDPSDVTIGTHGLYLQTVGTSSVFLPHVPVENHWDLATYLQELSLKAGLAKDGWKSSRLYRFSAELLQ